MSITGPFRVLHREQKNKGLGVEMRRNATCRKYHRTSVMGQVQQAHVFRNSTRVHRAWYDAEKRKVTVQFPDGVRWAYYNVGQETWDGFTGAASPGIFLRKVLEHHQNGPTGR